MAVLHQEFFEEYPLYRKYPIDIRQSSDIPRPSLHLLCLNCKSAQTFTPPPIGVPASPRPQSAQSPPKEIELITYTCAACHKCQRHFLIKADFQHRYIMKVGQEPPWDIIVDPTLAKVLGRRTDLYQKGLICESQNYGIGAFAYYRRIVEEIIDELLDHIPSLLSGPEQAQYREALAQAKASHVAEDKIDLVKNLLPSILRPDGMNPLAALHRALSEGLHQQSDDHCIELAEQIRETLIFLVKQLEESRENSARFTASMRKILDRPRHDR